VPAAAPAGVAPTIPTVVPEIPAGVKQIPSPLNPPINQNPTTAPLVPVTPASPLDPCKAQNIDPCAANISAKATEAAANAVANALGLVPTPFKQFDKCDNGVAKYRTNVIAVPRNMIFLAESLFEELAFVRGAFCEQQTAIASVPEWWQIRPEAHRPQMIYIYRVKNANGTWKSGGYSLTVPHPKQVTAATVVALPTYTKGNYQSILTLSDNSKVIVNGKDAAACAEMIAAAKEQIAEAYTANSSTKSGIRGGSTQFAQKEVTLWAIDYYSKGSFGDMKPDWRKLVR
jgi:hypothetical protein